MSRPERAPSFQFYPKDWLSDENRLAMTHAQCGIYIDLIAIEWNEGSLPESTKRLANMVSESEKRFLKHWSVIKHAFVPHPDMPGRIVHPRNEKERNAQSERKLAQSTAGKRGAAKRWGGHDDVKPPHKDPMKTGMGSDSSSSATASAPAITPPHPATPQKQLAADGYYRDCVMAWNHILDERHNGAWDPIVASNQYGKVLWCEHGIPLDVAIEVVEKLCHAFQVTDRQRGPNSIKYFDAAVRETWEGKEQDREIDDMAKVFK